MTGRPGPGRNEAAERAGDQARHVVGTRPTLWSAVDASDSQSATITGFTGETHDRTVSHTLVAAAALLAIVGCGQSADATSRKQTATRSSTAEPAAAAAEQPSRPRRRSRRPTGSRVEQAGFAESDRRSTGRTRAGRPMPPVLLSKQHEALCKVKVGDALPAIELPKVGRNEQNEARRSVRQEGDGRRVLEGRSPDVAASSWPTSGRMWSSRSASRASRSSASR